MRKRKIVILVCVIALLLYCVLWALWENEAKISNAKYGVEYVVVDVTPTNIICQIKKAENGSLKICMIPFVVEKRTILGWNELEIVEGAFSQKEYIMLEVDKPYDFGISLGKFCGKLSNGTYRLKIAVCGSEEKVEGYCYIVFEI